MENIKSIISSGEAVLGIELGSTRIKSVLIDTEGAVIETGGYNWENKFENGIWTYGEEDILCGLKESYTSLANKIEKRYGVKISKLKAIGISGMMHGYLPLDENNKILSPFRTWRNTITAEASELLSELFDFHVPQRWSIAHLCKSVMNKEEHVHNIKYFTTLAGYIHLLLTGEKVNTEDISVTATA